MNSRWKLVIAGLIIVLPLATRLLLSNPNVAPLVWIVNSFWQVLAFVVLLYIVWRSRLGMGLLLIVAYLVSGVLTLKSLEVLGEGGIIGLLNIFFVIPTFFALLIVLFIGNFLRRPKKVENSFGSDPLRNPVKDNTLQLKGVFGSVRSAVFGFISGLLMQLLAIVITIISSLIVNNSQSILIENILLGCIITVIISGLVYSLYLYLKVKELNYFVIGGCLGSLFGIFLLFNPYLLG